MIPRPKTDLGCHGAALLATAPVGFGEIGSSARKIDAPLLVCIYAHMHSRDVIRVIEADGWRLVGVTGSHHHFKHPTKPGKVTIPHPRKDMALPTLISIERQADVKLRRQ